MNRLQRLEARRTDPMVKAAQLRNELYRDIQQSDAVRYAVGAMQPIDPEYTRNTFAQGDRVRDQLKGGLQQSCEYRYQGSTTNDTHIKARSDIDLLVILSAWCWLEPPQRPEYPYLGDEKADMRTLRQDSEQTIRDAFPKVEMDDSGSKSISLEGGSLTRKVDVVPATWFNTNEFARTRDETYRGIEIFDIGTGLFVLNMPFLHNARIEEKDRRTSGGLRKAARLMKSLKYDSELVEMSSYDIVSIAYNMPDTMLAIVPPFELRILDSCLTYCCQLREDPIVRASISVPNNTRTVFDAKAGATVTQLDQLIGELRGLSQDILRENARSFVKLAAARVEHPMRLHRPLAFGAT